MIVQEMVAAIMRGSADRPRRVVGLALGMTAIALAVLLFVPPEVETDVQAGTFAIGDPQADAFRALRADVAGINSELVYFELAPGATADGVAVDDVRDRAASQSIDDMYEYIDRRFQEETGEDKVIDYTGFPYLIKLVYSYFPDGEFAMPPTQEEYDAAVSVLMETDDGTLDFYFSEDYRSTVISIVYLPTGDKAATAGMINDLIAEYRALPVGADKAVDLWDGKYLDSWGIQSWIAVVDRSVEHDLLLLVPIALLALFIVMSIALRDVKRAAIAMLTVGTVLIWTLAAMTALGLPIGFISMALFPLLLGVGVDYAIHLQHEAMVHGGDIRQAIQHSGRRAGTALVVATLTTVTGFVVIMFSRSPMIIEIATATIVGMTLMLMASLTLLPALSALTERAMPARPIRGVLRTAARGLRRHRAVAAAVAVVIVGMAIPLSTQTQFAVETVQSNLPARPEPSHMLVMYDRFEEKMESTGQESVIHQGDLATPAAMEEIIQTHEAMERQSDLFDGVLSLPFVIDLHQTLEGGPLGPLQTVPQAVLAPIIDPIQGEPEQFSSVRAMDADQLQAALEGMWADERWTPLIQSFTDADFSITWTFSFINIPASPEATARGDEAMSDVVADVNPTVLDTEYFGTLSALHRINAQAKEWLTISAVADLAVLAALVAVVTRSWRAVGAAVTTLAAGMVVWLALLSQPAFDLRMSFVYLIPLAFITSLGSDYAVHLVNGLVRGKDSVEETANVGRAVLYSAGTTAVAFAIFLWGSIPGSIDMFASSVLAVLVAAAMSLLIAPLWFPAKAAETATVDAVAVPA